MPGCARCLSGRVYRCIRDASRPHAQRQQGEQNQQQESANGFHVFKDKKKLRREQPNGALGLICLNMGFLKNLNDANR
jgi:hypothetical protein